MKIFLLVIFACILFNPVYSASMFDDAGNYSGNWKQMTNINTSSYNQKYSSANYSSSAWQQNNKKQQALKNNKPYSTQYYIESSSVPFRYDTLDYKRIRQVQGGHGESYSARCHDIGDVSFCR